jgi:hypothetical protein
MAENEIRNYIKETYLDVLQRYNNLSIGYWFITKKDLIEMEKLNGNRKR